MHLYVPLITVEALHQLVCHHHVSQFLPSSGPTYSRTCGSTTFGNWEGHSLMTAGEAWAYSHAKYGKNKYQSNNHTRMPMQCQVQRIEAHNQQTNHMARHPVTSHGIQGGKPLQQQQTNNARTLGPKPAIDAPTRPASIYLMPTWRPRQHSDKRVRSSYVYFCTNHMGHSHRPLSRHATHTAPAQHHSPTTQRQLELDTHVPPDLPLSGQVRGSLQQAGSCTRAATACCLVQPFHWKILMLPFLSPASMI